MGLLGGSDTRINATFTATDHVTPVVRGLRAEFTKLGSKTGGPLGGVLGGLGGISGASVGAVAGFTAIVGVADAAGKALAGFIEAGVQGQAVDAKLTTSLNDNVKGWQNYQSSLNGADEAGVRLGFANDDLANSMAQIVSHTHDVNKAVKVQQAAMDLARFRGISLAQASDVLGKAWDGNTTSLKKLGIQLVAGTKGIQAIGAVETVVGGQAEAFTKTFQGQLAVMASETDRLQEHIGMGLVPVMGDALTSVNDWAFGTQKAMGTIDKSSAKSVDSLVKLGYSSDDVAKQIQADAYREAYALGSVAVSASTMLKSIKKDERQAVKDLQWTIHHGGELAHEQAQLSKRISNQMRIGLKSDSTFVKNQVASNIATMVTDLGTLSGKAVDTGQVMAWFEGALTGTDAAVSYSLEQLAKLYAAMGNVGGSGGPPAPSGGHTPDHSQSYKDAYRKRYREQHPSANSNGVTEIHTHVHIDGKEVAVAVDRRFGLGWPSAGSGTSRN